MNNKAKGTASGKQQEIKKQPVSKGLLAAVIVGIVLLLGAGIGGLLYFQQSGQNIAYLSDGKINEKITKSEYMFFLEGVKQEMLYNASAEQGADVDPKAFWALPFEGEDAATVAKRKALESAKENKVQLIKAKQEEVTLTQSDLQNIDSYIEMLVAQFGGKTNADAELKKYGISIEQFRELSKQREITGRLAEKKTGTMKFTEADMKKYYEDNKMKQYQPVKGAESVWARHILFLTVDANQQPLPADKQEEARKKAEAALERAKKGEDFAKMAKELSEDPGSKDNGGQYVFGRNMMEKAFEDTAFSLKPGEISGLVKTGYGYHIIKLEEKIPAGQAISYNGAKDYYKLNEEILKTSEYQKIVDQWNKEFNLKINEQVYNQIKVTE